MNPPPPYRRKKDPYPEYPVEDIAKFYERFQRFTRVAILIILVVGVAASIGVFGSWYAIHQIQDQRREAFKNSCIVRNKSNQAIIDVLRGFDVSDPAILSKFPVEPDCKAYARKAAP